MGSSLDDVVNIFKELQEDSTVSKNIKAKVAVMQRELEQSSGDEISLKVNKILSELEDLSSDVNLPMFVRTQIWNLTSMLEALN